MIVVVDYGLGNLASVRHALQTAGAEVVVSSDRSTIERARGVVLPGVGAAAAGMERLRARGLEGVITGVARAGRPLLGLCLGMQLLFGRSAEGDVECLGLLPGTVRLLRSGVKVPQIGWNQVEQRGGSDLWKGLGDRPYFYFVHSYVCEPAQASLVAGITEYGEQFCSVAVEGNVWGTQFHPERSGRSGLRLIRNFVELCSAA